MLKLVVDIVFKLIAIIGSVILVPILAVLSPVMSLFGFAEFIPSILSFIDTALTYANFFIVSLHVPLAPLILVVSISGVLLTLTISLRTILLIKSIYGAIKGWSGGKFIAGFGRDLQD